MDRAVVSRMAAQEELHWWFAARREIIRTVIVRLVQLPDRPRILEAGCGTGGNLEMLAGFGQVRAFELDSEARRIAAAKSGLAVAEGALPDAIPFDAERFDMIGLFDVLEHVEDDGAALSELRDRLAPGGKMVLTVPAFPWLWSRHDVRHHHFRRYTRRDLARVAEHAGLRVEHSFYFNTLLFPAAVVQRAVKSIFGVDHADDTLPPPALNSALRWVFAAERHLVGRLAPPVGLTLCAVMSTAAGP
jgi:SAM-dependent methyltransferase